MCQLPPADIPSQDGILYSFSFSSIWGRVEGRGGEVDAMLTFQDICRCIVVFFNKQNQLNEELWNQVGDLWTLAVGGIFVPLYFSLSPSPPPPFPSCPPSHPPPRPPFRSSPSPFPFLCPYTPLGLIKCLPKYPKLKDQFTTSNLGRQLKKSGGGSSLPKFLSSSLAQLSTHL